MRYPCLTLVFVTIVACGSARSDPFEAPQPDAASDNPTAQDTPQTGCAAVEGMGCACGAIVVGRWRCAGDTPVCVCPMPVMDSGAVRPDAPDVPREPSDVAVPFPCATGSLYCASIRACVDVAVNRSHCGGCDRACASSEMCVQGACVRPDAGIPVDATSRVSLDVQVSMLAITFTAGGQTREYPRAQSCTVRGNTTSFGAEFCPESGIGCESVAGLLQSSGVGSTMSYIGRSGVGSSDIRPTVTRGTPYTSDVQRINLRVTGTFPVHGPIEVTVLGCLVQ